MAKILFEGNKIFKGNDSIERDITDTYRVVARTEGITEPFDDNADMKKFLNGIGYEFEEATESV